MLYKQGMQDSFLYNFSESGLGMQGMLYMQDTLLI